MYNLQLICNYKICLKNCIRFTYRIKHCKPYRTSHNRMYTFFINEYILLRCEIKRDMFLGFLILTEIICLQ